MSRKQRLELIRILIGLAVFAAGWCVPDTLCSGWAARGVFAVAYVIAGWDVLWASLRNILRGEVFDENFLMAVASVGAMALGDFAEGAAVMLFYQVGEWFQAYAVGRTRGSIAALMDIRPDFANVLRGGQTLRVDPEEVQVGETILVRPGERVPLDGTILKGESTLDTAALTGESLPRPVLPGDPAPSGCINLSGLLEIRADKHYGDSTVARILQLVEEAAERKARTEAFITRFARVYTPFVCIAALLLALTPPLLFGGAWGDWVYRALTFLVISCPCALVISVPLSFFGGIGAASRRGVLLKGSNALETLAHVRTVVFDKTGTLTRGAFAVTQVLPAPGFDRTTLLTLAAHAESASTHPLAKAIVAAAPSPIDPAAVANLREHAGRGVSADVHGRTILAGNAALLRANAIEPPADALTLPGSTILIAIDGTYAGAIVAQDQPKEDAKAAIDGLHHAGVRKTVMLTGDNEPAARAVAETLGLDAWHAKLLPADKVTHLERLLNETHATPKARLAFVGDGINDAPVLARADLGVAMGALGSDAAIEAADVVLMDDRPSKLAAAIRISRGTLTIAWQNIIFAIGVKAAILILGALGLANLWLAVFADVGVAFLAILNALRALAISPKEP